MEIDVVEIDPEVIQMAKDSFQRPRRKKSSTSCPGRTALFDPYSESVRYHPDRRLFFGRYAVSPGHARVFRAGAEKTHSQRHRRRQSHQRRHRPLRQNRPCLCQDPAAASSRRPMFLPRAVRTTSAWTRYKTSSSSPRETSSGSTSKTSSNAPLPSIRGFFPIRSTTLAWPTYDGPLPDQDVPVLTDDYAPTDNLLHP